MSLKVNLGCGTSALPGWDNLDISYSIILSRHLYIKKMLFIAGLIQKSHYNTKWPPYVRRHNIISGLPYKNDSIDYIYTSHFLEHVAKPQAEFILQECYRCLKPGGIIRIVVPDLEKLARCYIERDPTFIREMSGELGADKFLNAIGKGKKNHKSIPLKIYSVFVESDVHKWMWDYESLRFTLLSSGFEVVEKVDFLKGKVPDIDKLDIHPWDSLHLEATK